MRTQNHRTRTQNVSVSRSRTASVTASAASGKNSRSRSASRGSRNKSENRKYGTRAIWMLMFVGAMIATGFVLAQRSQINAYQLKHVEEELKSELDTLSSQQRYLIFQKERALSTRESDRAAKESGLIQLKLDRANARQVQPEAETKIELKALAKSNGHSPKEAGKARATNSSKSSANLSNKQIQAVKSNKEGKAKVTQTGKPASKDRKQQLAQNQTSRKGSTSQDKRH